MIENININLNDKRKELIEFYNTYKTRSLALGNENVGPVEVDGLYYEVIGEKIIFCGLDCNYIENYMENHIFVLPDYFDIINQFIHNYPVDDCGNLMETVGDGYKFIVSSVCNLNEIENIKLGQNIKFIFHNAFKDLHINHLDLGGMERVCKYCFSDSYVKSVYGGMVEIVDDFAFSDCIYLESLNFPNINTIGNIFLSKNHLINFKSIRLSKNLTYLPDELFKPVPQLEEIDGTEGVVYVGKYCFTNTKITSIDLSSCKEIGHASFLGSSLRKIKISDSLEKVDFMAFHGIKNHLLDRFIVEFKPMNQTFYKKFLNSIFVDKLNDCFLEAKVNIVNH